MKFKKSFFTALVLLALVSPSFATAPSFDGPTKSAKALTEIQSIVKNIDFDLATLDKETIKVHFMVNSANEVVVLRTSSDKADSLIKYNLNYRALENRDLEINKVYILPIKFEALDIS